MNKYVDILDDLNFEDSNIFMNTELPEIQYLQLSKNRDAGIMLTLFDIDGEESILVLPHELLKEMISELQTADENLTSMNTETF